ncbi:MAG: preprotein translocase subunit SecE [Olsenella sp.]|nr:preprotein translocase subunit SecE [Olsenella sp.]
MAKKERQKRSARKARAAERAELEAKQAASAASSDSPKASDKKAGAALASKKADAAAKAEKGTKKSGLFGTIRTYFRDVKSEIHRVVWPSRRELKNYSVAAIAMLIVCGVFFWLVDTGFVALLVAYTGLRG